MYSGLLCQMQPIDIQSTNTDSPKCLFIIEFYSRQLPKQLLHYPIFLKEFKSLHLLISKWQIYLIGREFLVYSDNRSICYWKNLAYATIDSSMIRSVMFLNAFCFKILYLPTKIMPADYLSRQAATKDDEQEWGSEEDQDEQIH